MLRSRSYFQNKYKLSKERTGFTDVRVDDPSLPERIQKLVNNKHTKGNTFLQSFLPSVLEQFNTKGYLTEKQVLIIEKNEKWFDPEALAKKDTEYKSWCKEYDDEKREAAKKVAEYYKNEYESGKNHTFWYEKTATKVLEDPDYIPTKQQYEKMVLNKYAQSWLKNSSAQPKFAEGDYVTLNAQAKTYWNQRNFGGEFSELSKFEIGTIIDIEPPKHNRKGANICIVLPMGGATTIQIEERFLKKARGV